MTIVQKCPSCGFESPEIRCPRCNALKVVGCDGVCSACASSCGVGSVAEAGCQPGDEAADDERHESAPLER